VVERHYSEVRAFRLFVGSTAIHNLIIAKHAISQARQYAPGTPRAAR